ncbi:hypothetical protein GQ600_10788 [Phytophthora cactorum]|nr:hypothetical protein GQ600_10788 [Phytophthora cactorum]
MEPSEALEKMQVLTPQQLSALNEAKYLRDHPDVAKLMRALVRGILRIGLPTPAYTYQFFSRDGAAIRQDLDAKE